MPDGLYPKCATAAFASSCMGTSSPMMTVPALVRRPTPLVTLGTGSGSVSSYQTPASCEAGFVIAPCDVLLYCVWMFAYDGPPMPPKKLVRYAASPEGSSSAPAGVVG